LRARLAREPDPERFIYLLDKWNGLENALRADADVLVVAFPEVLGDTYTELVINLGRIAASGKSLGITKPIRVDKELDNVDRW